MRTSMGSLTHLGASGQKPSWSSGGHRPCWWPEAVLDAETIVAESQIQAEATEAEDNSRLKPSKPRMPRGGMRPGLKQPQFEAIEAEGKLLS